MAAAFVFNGKRQTRKNCIDQFKDLATGKYGTHRYLLKYFIESIKKWGSLLVERSWTEQSYSMQCIESIDEIVNRNLYFDKFLFECAKKTGQVKSVKTNIFIYFHDPNRKSFLDKRKIAKKREYEYTFSEIARKVKEGITEMRALIMHTTEWVHRGYSKPFFIVNKDDPGHHKEIPAYKSRAERTDAFVEIYLDEYSDLMKRLARSIGNSEIQDRICAKFDNLIEQAKMYRVDLDKKAKICQKPDQMSAEKAKYKQNESKDKQIDEYDEKKKYSECDGNLRWILNSLNKDEKKITKMTAFRTRFKYIIRSNCIYDNYIYKCLMDNHNERVKIQKKSKEKLWNMAKISGEINDMLMKYLVQGNKHAPRSADWRKKKNQRLRENQRKRKQEQAAKNASPQNDQQIESESTGKETKKKIIEEKKDESDAHINIDNQFISNIVSANDVEDESMNRMDLYGYNQREYNYDNKLNQRYGITLNYFHKELMDVVCLALVILFCAFIHCGLFIICVISGWFTKTLVQSDEQKDDFVDVV